MATKSATNPRSRKGSAKKNQENDVTDTATQEAPVEETAAAPEAAANDESTSTTLSSKSEVAPEDALFDAIVKFASDSDSNALQEVYRSVHASSRGKAQGVAMKRAMTEGNVDMEVLSQVLDAFNNLPAATKTTRTRPKVDDATLATIRLAGLMVGFNALQAELGEEAFAAANKWFADGAPEEHTQAILKVADNAIKASSKGVRTRSGGRSSMKEKVSDLVSRGDLTAGQVLKGANGVTATVTAEGKLQTTPEGGETQEFDNPSAAARVHRVKEDGKATSTNGWDFWSTEDGKSIGDLRQS